MSENDVDDIAFLTGSNHEGGFLMNKRAVYEHGGVMVCSQRRACFAVSLGFVAIIGVALIIAFTKPGCPEATYTGEPLDDGRSNGGNSKARIIYKSTTGEDFPWTNIRLPQFIFPHYYAIELHPNISAHRVKGNVTITLTAIEETSFVVLNGRNLKLTYYSLKDKHNQEINIVKYLVFPHHEQMYFGLSSILHRGSNYSLSLRFHASLSEGLDGFYVSHYTTNDGVKKYLASTHFEPTSARSAFPCFDEPHMKARFKMSIVRPIDHISLFNMPLLSSTNLTSSNLVLDQFEESVQMSTYLIAFVVCDFAKISKKTSNGVIVSVYAAPMLISQVDYALNAAVTILQYYEDFFQVDYPLPKQDLIALPNFAAGAMENWGLITYQENVLMFDPDHTSAVDQQTVTVVIAHELAHQWFGNLVTMAWWNDLWLNEGFASFMENLGASMMQPTWGMAEQFVVENVHPALDLDALMASHPISTSVQNPSQIESIFDAISYKKGASIIRMVEVFVGRDVLQQGLRSYLMLNRYGSANTTDLWASLSKAANGASRAVDVQKIMNTWTLQAGFPLISIKMTGTLVNVSQSRFLECVSSRSTIDPNRPVNATLGYKWYVPLTYVSSANPNGTKFVWMNNTDVTFNLPEKVSWIKFNVGQTGFYRVHYDTKDWAALMKLLLSNHLRLSASDRASLIDDIFSLVRSGMVSAKVALDTTKYLAKEEAYAPWHTVLRHLFKWADLLFSRSTYTLMMSYIQSVIKPHYLRLGWNNEGSHLDKLLRSKVLLAAVECGLPDAIEKATESFDGCSSGSNNTVSPDLRLAVYSSAIRHGLQEDWWRCWNLYSSSTIPSEKSLMLKSLAQTTDPWILQQYLSYTLNSSKIVSSQDVLTVLKEVGATAAGRLPAWRFVRKNWKALMNKFSVGSFTIGAIIKVVTSGFSSQFDLHEVNEFFSGQEIGSGSRSLSQSLEMIRLRIQWVDNNYSPIKEWLEDFFQENLHQ